MGINGDMHEDTPTPPSRSTVVLLLSMIGDTTWRMFFPTIGLTIVGVFLDNTYGLKPWFTLLGIIIGSVIAGLLIRKQLTKKIDE